MSDLKALYQEMILDHSKKPRNFHSLEHPTRIVEGYNPLCGDRFKLYLLIVNNVIEDISFEGTGCAISKASASMMTSMLKGRNVSEAKEIFEMFHKMLSGKEEEPLEKLGKLAVFSGVCEYPARVKCATLAWHTMKSGLDSDDNVVSTE